MEKTKKTEKMNNRLYLLDTIRGMAIIGMIFIHVTYDLPGFFGIYPGYMYSDGYEFFCQCVRATFIFLSGYCACMGKRTLNRGLIVSAAGLLVTVVSIIARVDVPIFFGVLTLIGACMLLSVPFKKIINKKNAPAFIIVNLFLFIFTLHISNGYFGFLSNRLFQFPESWYRISNPVLLYPMAFLGFPGKGFDSSDYFPLMPWFFLFMAGFSLYALCGEALKEKKFMSFRLEPMAFLGKYSLWVYLLHQPVLMGIMTLIARILSNFK